MMKHLVITWQGSKRASSSIAEKPSKKSRKNTIDLTEIDKQVSSYSSVYLLPYLCIWLSNFNVCFRQNIDADLGRVIAKVSSQINPSTSMKVAEKKKEKKKDKRASQEEPSEQKDNSTQATPIEVLNVEKPKDKKKLQYSTNNLATHKMPILTNSKILLKRKSLSRIMRVRIPAYSLHLLRYLRTLSFCMQDISLRFFFF
jgi:hypothetical protein